MGYIINNGIPYGGGSAKGSDTGWIALNERISYRVKNGLCTIVGESLGHISLENNVTKTMVTLPSEIIPSKTVRFCVNSCGSTDTDAVSLVGIVNTNGALQIFCNNLDTTSLKFWSFSVTYPVEGSVGVSDGGSSENNTTDYTLPVATSSTLGGVKIGSNITNSAGTISLTSSNVTTALGYTPATQTYVTEQIQASIKAAWEARY